ncbi:hypothetical protein LIER_02301 [Lithospermum erythrorhizon]|uniref:Uncharacterized protein n=1 Tax=Lithospermum erythrorhizon TaxID=34254 RepID=A0AAV3NP01_LITER
MVEVDAQNPKKKKKLRKGKGEGSKAPVSTKERGYEDVVLNPTPLRSIPPTADITQEKDADVGGDGSRGEIHTDEDDIREPIVKERVRDSSCANATDLSEHTATPSATDSIGKTVEPSNIYVSSGVDNPDGITVDVSSVNDIVTDASKQESVENFGKAVDPSVKDTVDGLKENAPIEGYEARPTVIDTSNDTEKDENVTPSVRDIAMEDAKVVASMDVPSVDGTSNVTEGREDVTPNVADNGVGAGNLSEEGAKPIVGEGVVDTLNTEEVKIPEATDQEMKKSKKRKHKKGTDEGEASEPKKRLSKEERAAKRARRAERKAKKTTEKTTEDDVQEVGEEQRNPKNVAAVSTENVALNSEDEEAKWKFVASRRIAAERMLFEVTKKNADIMGILEDVGVRPTVESVGPYFPKLVREFIYNMTDDIDEPESAHFQKVTLRNRTVEFYPSIINAYYGIIEAQQPNILTATGEEAPSPGFITIILNLL